MQLGDARVITGTTKIVHRVNVTLLQEAAASWQSMHFPEESTVTPIILDRIRRITQSVDYVQPLYLPRRSKRWDQLGSGWKWLAGNPDADDLRTINSALLNVNSNNDKQIIINNNFENLINEITKNLKVLDKISLDNIEKISLDLTLVNIIFQLENLENQINQIQNSIIFSKVNLVNHHLLSKDEILLISNYLQEQNVSFNSLDQALSFTEISIAFQKGILVYTIKLPKLTPEVFKMLRVEALAIKREKIRLPGTIFIINDHQVFTQIGECQIVNEIHICKERNLREILGDECLQPILKGLPGSCHYTEASNNPKIIQMSSDVVLAMNVNTNLVNTCKVANRSLKGTYLIKFQECSISLGHETFYNDLLATVNQVLMPPTNGVNITKKSLIKEANLDALHESHILNLEKLERLGKNTSIMQHSLVVTASIILLSIIIIFVCLRLRLSTGYLFEKIKRRAEHQKTKMNQEVHH